MQTARRGIYLSGGDMTAKSDNHLSSKRIEAKTGD